MQRQRVLFCAASEAVALGESISVVAEASIGTGTASNW